MEDRYWELHRKEPPRSCQKTLPTWKKHPDRMSWWVCQHLSKSDPTCWAVWGLAHVEMWGRSVASLRRKNQNKSSPCEQANFCDAVAHGLPWDRKEGLFETRWRRNNKRRKSGWEGQTQYDSSGVRGQVRKRITHQESRDIFRYKNTINRTSTGIIQCWLSVTLTYTAYILRYIKL